MSRSSQGKHAQPASRTRRNAKRLLVTVLVPAVVGGGTIAYALWGASGAGSATTKATTAQALTTVDVSASTTASLYPGGAGSLVLKISNPNPYDVTVTSVASSGAATVDAGHSGCTTAGISFTTQTGLSIAVPAGLTSAVTTFATAVTMASGALDNCQGAVFTVPVTLTGTQA